jgi:hypothetical protein
MFISYNTLNVSIKTEGYSRLSLIQKEKKRYIASIL